MIKVRLKNLTALCLSLLMAVLFAFPAFAASGGPASDTERATVRMGFFEFGGMFEGAGEGLDKSGYCYEYMMQVATYTGWKYEFVYDSYSNLYEMLRKGEIDILPYTNYNYQRASEVLFSDLSIAEEEYYIAVPQGSSTETESLNGAVISTLEGADYNTLLLDYIDQNELNASVCYFEDLEDTWEAVRSGKAGATVFTSNAYIDEGWNCICSFGNKPTYIAVSRNREDLLTALNEACEMITIDNPALLGQLYAQYFSNNPMRRSLSQEELHWLEEHPVLHVGGFAGDAPYIFSSDNDALTATGLTPDVVNGIIDRLDLGITADYRTYTSLSEMEAALDSGEIDVIIPFYPSYYIAQEHDLVISNTVRVSNMELVYKKDLTYQQALRLIATPVTKLGGFYVQDTFPDSVIVPAVSIQDAVDKVRSGEATGAIAQNVVLHNIKEKYNDLNYTVLLEGCGTCFATRPENYPLIRIINRGLNYFSTAEISSISSLYNLEPNVTTKEYLATHTEAIILLVVIFVILVGLVISLLQMNHLKQKADEASRAKTNFLFNMSHDIRTPLNAITGFSKMALKSADNSAKVSEYLEKIDISGSQLLSLVNQILEMSRIESGKLVIDEQPVDISREFDRLLTVLTETAAVNGLEFTSALDIIHPRVFADSSRMASITLNITGNAMKYTPKGGSIHCLLKEIQSRKEGYGTYVFTVSDTGIGMSPEFQKELFEPFSREKNSTVSRIQGAGLGMSIVKKLVDMMGGEILVNSEQGKGTRFDITIDLRLDKDDRSGEGEADEDYTLEGKTILLVEDNMLNREIAADILKDAGIKVEEADDGSAAVALLIEKGPDYYDYILMDIQMPIMDGYEATKQIRAMYPEKHIPIIALSANAFAEDRAASMDAGMDDHVAKPINIKELFGALSRFR